MYCLLVVLAMSNIKKLPPYAKSIPENQNCIVVCTGSEAWNRAKSMSWLSRLNKTLLPSGNDPDSFRWDFVSGKEVVIFSNGIIEKYDRLVELSRCILQYGARSILWCIPEFKMMKLVNRDAV